MAGAEERLMPVPLDARLSPRLSIVAPCYNEEGGLEGQAGRLPKPPRYPM